MKKLITLAVSAALITQPAYAQQNPFGGVYAQATAGYDDITGSPDSTDVTYGGAVGVNVPVGNVIVGAQATVDNIFDRRNIGVSGRLGYNVADRVLPYVKVGWANYQDVFNNDLNGVRVGGGFQYRLGSFTYAKAEYRYSDFQNGVGQHGALVGLGIRF